MPVALKFLAAGRISPFGGRRWPEPFGDAPGHWVRPAGGEVYACRVIDLPWWLEAELWEVELEDPVATLECQLLAPAGRLMRRIQAWDEAAVLEYGAACALRARDFAVNVLREEGRTTEAETLAEPGELDGVARLARSLGADAVRRRGANLAAYVAESAARAAQGAGAAAANIAANAAVVARRHPAAFGVEREWQARWIARRTGLAQN